MLLSTQDRHTWNGHNLIIACELSQVQEVKRLLQEEDAPLDLEDATGNTPLLSAVHSGKDELLSILLEAKANVNQQAKTHGYSALHVAAKLGSLQAVQCLLKAGADVALVNSFGRTPLAEAEHWGHADTALLLLVQRFPGLSVSLPASMPEQTEQPEHNAAVLPPPSPPSPAPPPPLASDLCLDEPPPPPPPHPPPAQTDSLPPPSSPEHIDCPPPPPFDPSHCTPPSLPIPGTPSSTVPSPQKRAKQRKSKKVDKSKKAGHQVSKEARRKAKGKRKKKIKKLRKASSSSEENQENDVREPINYNWQEEWLSYCEEQKAAQAEAKPDSSQYSDSDSDPEVVNGDWATPYYAYMKRKGRG
eukprot:g48726.t1